MLTSEKIIISPSYSSLIQEHISLADKTWFRTGGPARFYAQPQTSQEFQQALQFAHEHNLHIFVLGEGANILISDAGFNGLVIHPKLNKIEHIQQKNDHPLVEVEAGTSMNELIEFCLEHQLIGLEEFSGIPGTVGGSVYINLHYFEFLLSQFLIQAQIIEKETGTITTVDNEWFNFGYNRSTLHEGNHYLISATFTLQNSSEIETAYARGRRTEIIRHRLKRYPQSHTCGSFFRNFHEDEVTIESNGKKMIYVAYYLDKIGIKGILSVGDAIVSYQHANMIVNRGNASTQNIIDLAQKMQELVHNQFGIIPQPECRLVGFEQYPLMI